MTHPLITRIALVLALIAPQSAAAHPHVFIDTTIEVIVNDKGAARGVRITWLYDPLTTLMMLEGQGLDLDFDGKLTVEETAQLQGFDMNWAPGFAGDTYALMGGAPMPLGAPTEISADYIGERLSSTHARYFPEPVAVSSNPLIIQSYDPEYYTAYFVVDAKLDGSDFCAIQIYTPDLSEADIATQATLELLGPEVDISTNFPLVGAAYAEEARVTCPAG